MPEGVTIRSGYSANAQIVLQQALQVLSIPESTLSFEGDSTFVYVSEAGSYVKRSVSTGVSDGINIQITGGLEGGETLRGNKIINVK